MNSEKRKAIPPRRKVCKRGTSQEWWHTPEIPTLEETEAGDHKFRLSLGKPARPCLIIQNKTGLEMWLGGKVRGMR